jgi:hypothetical protein
MPIEYVAYAFVRRGGTQPRCKLHTVSTDVGEYLIEHVEDLLKRVERGTIPPARFRRPAALTRFDQLRSGSQAQFLAAAQDLTSNLHTAMHPRSKPGFFVALRDRNGEGDRRAAVLKLDVHDERAAVVRQVGSDLELEAIKDLLDVPGELQKGAVHPDPRRDSDVVVGDKAIERTAEYFLLALEVQQISPPGKGPSVLIRVVNKLAPDRVQKVAEIISGYQAPVTPKQLFDDHPDVLTGEQLAAVLKGLEDEPRPVRTMNSVEGPPRSIVRAGSLSITGPATDVDRLVNWERSGGEWVIEIHVSEQPSKTYQ